MLTWPGEAAILSPTVRNDAHVQAEERAQAGDLEGAVRMLMAIGWGVVQFARSGKASAIPRASLSQTISVHAGRHGRGADLRDLGG